MGFGCIGETRATYPQEECVNRRCTGVHTLHCRKTILAYKAGIIDQETERLAAIPQRSFKGENCDERPG